VDAEAAPVRALLRAAETRQRRAMLEAHLKEQLAEVLGQSPHRLDVKRPLHSLGLDSLMAVELRNRLEQSLGLALSATIVWSYPTLDALATHLASKMGLPLEVADEPTAGTSVVLDPEEGQELLDLLSALQSADDADVARALATERSSRDGDK
jgi:acyl carrier protein